LHHRPELHPVRRQRARAPALPVLLRHRLRPGSRQRDLGDPAAARGAGDGLQRPPPAKGDPPMTTVSADLPEPAASATPSAHPPTPPSPPAKPSVASRITAMTGHWAVRFALVVTALLWLMPTVGLLSSSLRSPADISISG